MQLKKKSILFQIQMAQVDPDKLKIDGNREMPYCIRNHSKSTGAEYLDNCIQKILESQWYSLDKIQYITKVYDLETLRRLKHVELSTKVSKKNGSPSSDGYGLIVAVVRVQFQRQPNKQWHIS